MPPPLSPGSQRKHGQLQIEVTTQRLLKSRGVRTAASLHLAGGGGALRPPRHLLSTGADPPGTWLDSSGKAVGCIVIFRGGNITALKPHNLLPHPAGARAAGGSAVPAAAPHPGPAPAWGSAAARAGLEAGQAQGRRGPADGAVVPPAPRRPPAGCQGRVPTRADGDVRMEAARPVALGRCPATPARSQLGAPSRLVRPSGPPAQRGEREGPPLSPGLLGRVAPYCPQASFAPFHRWRNRGPERSRDLPGSHRKCAPTARPLPAPAGRHPPRLGSRAVHCRHYSRFRKDSRLYSYSTAGRSPNYTTYYLTPKGRQSRRLERRRGFRRHLLGRGEEKSWGPGC